MTLCSAIEPYPGAAEQSFYGEELVLLENAIAEFLLRLDSLRRWRRLRGLHDPVDHYKARIKSAESMQQKLRRQGLPATRDAAIDQVCDAAGVRVVCPFIDDIATAIELIRKMPGVTVCREKDYITHPKPNGYRSYHLIVRMEVRVGAHSRPIWLEIQLRTIAMDCWASLEHQMKYKHEIADAALIAAELKKCAEEMASTDLSMQTIRDWLHDGTQEERSEIQDAVAAGGG